MPISAASQTAPKIRYHGCNKRAVKADPLFLIGLILIALGISVTIIADFGCGGWDATNIALVQHFGLSVGTWLNIWAFVYLLVACMIERKRYRIECMATSLIIGAGVDLFNYLLRFAVFEEAGSNRLFYSRNDHYFPWCRILSRIKITA